MLLLCAALSGYAPQASAVEGALMTGKALSLLCTSTKEEDRFSCQNYLAGVIDYHRLLKSLGTAPAVDFCMKPDTRMDQIAAIATRYIMQHKEHQDFIAAPAVVMSLHRHFPCKKPRARN